MQDATIEGNNEVLACVGYRDTVHNSSANGKMGLNENI